MDNNGLRSYVLLTNEHITPDNLCKNVINEQVKLVVCKFVYYPLVLRDNLSATEIPTSVEDYNCNHVTTLIQCNTHYSHTDFVSLNVCGNGE